MLTVIRMTHNMQMLTILVGHFDLFCRFGLQVGPRQYAGVFFVECLISSSNVPLHRKGASIYSDGPPKRPPIFSVLGQLLFL